MCTAFGGKPSLLRRLWPEWQKALQRRHRLWCAESGHHPKVLVCFSGHHPYPEYLQKIRNMKVNRILHTPSPHPRHTCERKIYPKIPHKQTKPNQKQKQTKSKTSTKNQQCQQQKKKKKKKKKKEDYKCSTDLHSQQKHVTVTPEKGHCRKDHKQN